MEIKGILQGKQDGGEGMGKNGQPWHRYVFVVDGKKYSCFDKAKFDSLEIGASVKITGEMNGQFFNLKDIVNDDIVEVVKPIQIEHTEKKVPTNTGAMYTSYAKDIFVAMLDPANKDYVIKDMMQTAIELVKQAKEAFE